MERSRNRRGRCRGPPASLWPAVLGRGGAHCCTGARSGQVEAPDGLRGGRPTSHLAMERSSEFAGVVEMLEPQVAQEATEAPAAGAAGAARQAMGGTVAKTEFIVAAEGIGRELEVAQKLVRRLEDLVEQRVAAVDPRAEIESVHQLFAQDVAQLGRMMKSLEDHIKSAMRGQRLKCCSVIVDTFRKETQAMMTGFQTALERRNHVLQALQERQKLFADPNAGGALAQVQAPLFGAAAEPRAAQRGRGEAKAARPSLRHPMAMPSSSSAQGAMPPPAFAGAPGSFAAGGASAPPAYDHLQQPMNQPRRRRKAGGGAQPLQGSDYGNGMPGSGYMRMELMQDSRERVETRVNEAHAVEKAIGELQGMFSKMASMLSQQAETVQRIDEDLEVAQVEVEEAQLELGKVLQIVSENRQIILITFALLVFFIFLFLVWT